VLSVGTIDKRKNQALLCRLWQRLVSDLGGSQVPQLALVGREDLTIADLDEGIASLVKTSKIVVLQGLSDAELAGLYRQCLFTAFPSLSEGYGLPVAESLQHGKLCISSDLAVIREHAGDLPWYFNPADDTAAYELVRRAIEDPDARTAAEQRIAGLHRPCSWASTYRAITDAAFEDLATRTGSNSASIKPYLPVVPGARVAAAPPIPATSEQWCTQFDPAVSIVIINCNAGQLTRECVRRIWANTDGPPYEIIIAENGSNPGDIAPLRTLGHNVRLLELGINRFFGEASNIAAESAKGQYLCFLDNTAFVQPGWLQSLVDALQHTPAAGAVGPCLLFPDNHIKEAGAAIDEAGYPVHFGRGQGADLTELLVPKYVDYVSAATLLLTRELFVMVGGFDLAYEPSSYEDADLCLKIRALGLKAHYCPESKVILAAASSADDNPVAESRSKALEDLNRGKFTSRWGAFLKSRSDADLERGRRSLPRYETDGKRRHTHAQADKKTAALFTPFALTPGGG
jgi:GT2 family glycosyltransferase